MNPQTGLRAIVMALVCILPLTAAAQATPAASSESDRATREELLEAAQAFVNQASQLYRQADYEGALSQLRQAAPLAEEANDPSLANIRFNIARCLEQLKRWPEAMTAYEAYNALPDEAHRKERAWAAVQGLKAKVYGTVSVSCFPAGARIDIPGVTTQGAQTCPWQSDEVRPGNYVVSVRNPGYDDFSREVIVVAGQAIHVEASLKAQPVSAPQAAVGQVAPVDEPVNVWPWVTVGVGVAALAAGGVFHGLAVSDRGAAEDLPPTPERDDVIESFEGRRTLAFALYGAGGAISAAGVVLYFLMGADDGADPEMVRWMPTADGVRVVF